MFLPFRESGRIPDPALPRDCSKVLRRHPRRLGSGTLSFLQRWGKLGKKEEMMKIVNISEAKTNLSKLVALVYRGEKVVIAKNNLPLVDLVIHKPEGKRKLGLLAGKFTVPDNIMEEDAEINTMFYGSDDT